jgi:hypothetical protein
MCTRGSKLGNFRSIGVQQEYDVKHREIEVSRKGPKYLRTSSRYANPKTIATPNSIEQSCAVLR